MFIRFAQAYLFFFFYKLFFFMILSSNILFMGFVFIFKITRVALIFFFLIFAKFSFFFLRNFVFCFN